jgi:hypothetical protein
MVGLALGDGLREEGVRVLVLPGITDDGGRIHLPALWRLGP